MVNIGDNNCKVYIGDREISAIYLGDSQIYPNSTPVTVLTAITLDNLTWVTDIPATGGTATSANCSFTVTGYYSDGTTGNVTSQATVSGSLVVASTTSTTREYIDDLTLTASYDGYTDSSSVSVYQAAATTDYSKEYLTFKITSAGQIKWFCNNQQTTNRRTIQYSTNNGSTWTSITSNRNAPYINVTTGDKVLFKGDNGTYMGSSNSYYNSFSGSTAGFELEGNIMSLIDSTNFSGLTSLPQTYTFQYMFAGCTGLTTAQNLVLPATSLVAGCYRYMFQHCSNLVNAPKLPATTLAYYCYQRMFENCRSLTTAPALPATTLAPSCYRYMFQYCSNLNYIKCLATDLSASNCLSDWVQGVASTGTFVKASGVTWPTASSGIPSGWTVIEE